VYLGAGGLVVLGAAPRGAAGAGDPLASAGRLVVGEAVLGGDDGGLVDGAGTVPLVDEGGLVVGGRGLLVGGGLVLEVLGDRRGGDVVALPASGAASALLPAGLGW
jgi:hypothetical protein